LQVIREEIALRKMLPTDPVVVDLDLRVLLGLEHGLDFRLARELIKVVVLQRYNARAVFGFQPEGLERNSPGNALGKRA
jgi:hypothetical protein